MGMLLAEFVTCIVDDEIISCAINLVSPFLIHLSTHHSTSFLPIEVFE